MSLPMPEPELLRLTAAGLPVVLVDARGDGVPSVTTDDVAGGAIATQHLVDLGHRSIGFIGHDADNPFGFTSGAQRELGYSQVLASAGLPHRPELVRHGPHDQAVAETLAGELLSLPDPPTAVFASSDVQAIGVLAAAATRGVRVPEDLSVIGYDDIELARYVELTTIRQSLFESGRLGARLLLEAVSGGEPAPVEHVLPFELIERATTGRAPR
jgi:DNA-binding LacI/PurR family transcriptional regulator